MAAPRKKKTDDTPTADELKEAVNDVQVTPQEEFDAVIVVKETNPDGGIATKVLMNGSIQATEVQTLLELAVLGWRDQIGLGQSKR